MTTLQVLLSRLFLRLSLLKGSSCSHKTPNITLCLDQLPADVLAHIATFLASAHRNAFSWTCRTIFAACLLIEPPWRYISDDNLHKLYQTLSTAQNATTRDTIHYEDDGFSLLNAKKLVLESNNTSSDIRRWMLQQRDARGANTHTQFQSLLRRLEHVQKLAISGNSVQGKEGLNTLAEQFGHYVKTLVADWDVWPEHIAYTPWPQLTSLTISLSINSDNVGLAEFAGISFGYDIATVFPCLQRLVLRVCKRWFILEQMFVSNRFPHLNHFEMVCNPRNIDPYTREQGNCDCAFGYRFFTHFADFLAQHPGTLTNLLLPSWRLQNESTKDLRGDMWLDLCATGEELTRQLNLTTIRAPLALLSLACTTTFPLYKVLHLQLTNITWSMDDFRERTFDMFSWPTAPHLKIIGLVMRKKERLPTAELPQKYPELQEIYVDMRTHVLRNPFDDALFHELNQLRKVTFITSERQRRYSRRAERFCIIEALQISRSETGQLLVTKEKRREPDWLADWYMRMRVTSKVHQDKQGNMYFE